MPRDPVELALLAATDLLPRGASVLVACSGGPDSLALTAALAACAEELGIRIAVGHVDHALRPESAADAGQVRTLSGRLGLPFHLRRLEALEVATLGLEAAAREARYAALADLAAEASADRVATAHTRRDQAETVLLRLARGGGAGALAGVRRGRALTRGITLVRPLLGVPREATEAYCRARGLPTIEDAHNSDPRRARARLRALMPALTEALNPRLEEALAGAARVAADEDGLLDRLARQALEGAALRDGFAADRLAAVEPALLRRALLIAAQGAARPERGHLEQLCRLVASGRAGRLDLPGGRAVIEGRMLRFEANVPPLPAAADLQVPGPGRYPWGGRALHVGAGAQRVDIRVAPFPWTLRGRVPGDRFRVAGRPEKKLGDVWQAEGIPASGRDRIPLLADARGRIFWVEGLPWGPACAAPPDDAVRFEFAPEMDALR
ncbi:MAG: tRNA lysidine(34) synthetase TilS [Myxococcales bacterium]